MDIQSIVIRLRGIGMTQTEIGDAIGCSQPTISDIERGLIGKVRPAYKIVEALTRLAEERGLRSDQKPNSPRRRSTDPKT